MNGNELMIGDWVLYGAAPIKVQHLYNDGHDDCVAEVTGLCSDNLLEEPYEQEREIYLKSVEPIPLTPEILEKNGFKQENCPYSRWCHAQVERMIITLYRSDTFYSIMINTDVYLPVLNNIQLHYVHELQHALKLCGIEKEIVL